MDEEGMSNSTPVSGALPVLFAILLPLLGMACLRALAGGAIYRSSFLCPISRSAHCTLCHMLLAALLRGVFQCHLLICPIL